MDLDSIVLKETFLTFVPKDINVTQSIISSMSNRLYVIIFDNTVDRDWFSTNYSNGTLLQLISDNTISPDNDKAHILFGIDRRMWLSSLSFVTIHDVPHIYMSMGLNVIYFSPKYSSIIRNILSTKTVASNYGKLISRFGNHSAILRRSTLQRMKLFNFNRAIIFGGRDRDSSVCREVGISPVLLNIEGSKYYMEYDENEEYPFVEQPLDCASQGQTKLYWRHTILLEEWYTLNDRPPKVVSVGGSPGTNWDDIKIPIAKLTIVDPAPTQLKRDHVHIKVFVNEHTILPKADIMIFDMMSDIKFMEGEERRAEANKFNRLNWLKAQEFHEKNPNGHSATKFMPQDGYVEPYTGTMVNQLFARSTTNEHVIYRSPLSTHETRYVDQGNVDNVWNFTVGGNRKRFGQDKFMTDLLNGGLVLGRAENSNYTGAICTYSITNTINDRNLIFDYISSKKPSVFNFPLKLDISDLIVTKKKDGGEWVDYTYELSEFLHFAEEYVILEYRQAMAIMSYSGRDMIADVFSVDTQDPEVIRWRWGYKRSFLRRLGISDLQLKVQHFTVNPYYNKFITGMLRKSGIATDQNLLAMRDKALQKLYPDAKLVEGKDATGFITLNGRKHLVAVSGHMISIIMSSDFYFIPQYFDMVETNVRFYSIKRSGKKFTKEMKDFIEMVKRDEIVEDPRNGSDYFPLWHSYFDIKVAIEVVKTFMPSYGIKTNPTYIQYAFKRNEMLKKKYGKYFLEKGFKSQTG